MWGNEARIKSVQEDYIWIGTPLECDFRDKFLGNIEEYSHKESCRESKRFLRALEVTIT